MKSLSHQDEVDAYIRRSDEEAERNRREWESSQPESFVMQAKMRALLDEKRKKDQG